MIKDTKNNSFVIKKNSQRLCQKKRKKRQKRDTHTKKEQKHTHTHTKQHLYVGSSSTYYLFVVVG